MLELPEKFIPHGYYCFDDSTEQCPFWDAKPNEYPEHEDGFCHFLNASDWDINESSASPTLVFSKNSNHIGKTIDQIFPDVEIDPISGKKIHLFGMSLIWDSCKECRINKEELNTDQDEKK